MTEDTPTTEEVRAEAISDSPSSIRPAEFDRWLAEVKAEVWEEGRLSQYLEYPRIAQKDNPYVRTP